MNPLSLGIGVIGLGLQAFGAFGAADNAKQAAEISKNIAGFEQGINEQRRTQMQLTARRQQTEIFRNMQRQRAMATAAAVNQGASTGSGLSGGLAQITGQSLFNSQGINQNLEIGQNIFSLNNSISSEKMKMADVQADMAENQAWASLGGSLVNNAGTIGNLGSNVMGMFG
jgi:hypothetical protein